MINFEKEIRDAAFDEDVPPLKVMRERLISAHLSI